MAYVVPDRQMQALQYQQPKRRKQAGETVLPPSSDALLTCTCYAYCVVLLLLLWLCRVCQHRCLASALIHSCFHYSLTTLNKDAQIFNFLRPSALCCSNVCLLPPDAHEGGWCPVHLRHIPKSATRTSDMAAVQLEKIGTRQRRLCVSWCSSLQGIIGRKTVV